MKKKLLLTSLLALSLMLSGCGKDDSKQTSAKKDADTKQNTASIVTDNRESNEEELNIDEDNSSKDKDHVKVDKETLKDLMDNSDYISRIKIQVDTNSEATTNFIEDYKGDLSNVDIKMPKSLTPGKEYILFYADGTDGKIKPTDSSESFIEISGTDDANLNYIEAHYMSNIDSGSKKDKESKDSNKLSDKESSSTKKESKTSKDSKNTKSSEKSSSKDKKTSKDSDKSSGLKDSDGKNSNKSSKSKSSDTEKSKK